MHPTSLAISSVASIPRIAAPVQNQILIAAVDASDATQT
jgi:hypothetical protein